MTLPIRPIPTEVVALEDGRVLGVGYYEGGGTRAAFAHITTFEEGKIKSLVQVTDTLLWYRLADFLRTA